MAVYMARAGDNGPVKIGWAVDVQARVRELQTAHHERLKVIRVLDGARKAEGVLHKKFAHLRIFGEWFTFSPEMLSADAEAVAAAVPKVVASKARGTAAILLSRIEEFCSESGMTERSFGLQVAANHNFLSRLRGGFSINLSTYDRAMALIEGRDMPSTQRKSNASARSQASA
jgi:hypothetical protein